MKKCYFMNCEVDDDMPTLGELLNSDRKDVKEQARLLIDKFGFKKDDVFCEDCFWK